MQPRVRDSRFGAARTSQDYRSGQHDSWPDQVFYNSRPSPKITPGTRYIQATFLLSLYCRLTGLASPISRAYLRRRLAQGREDATRLEERLAIASQPRPAGPLVWIHAADISAALSALPLISHLRRDHHILMTTRLPATADLMAQQLPKDVIHQYVPVDVPNIVKRFMNHWRPDASIWMETDFRPNLIMAAAARRMPMALLNARMTKKEFRRWSRLPGFVPPLLKVYDLICSQSIRDAAHLKVMKIGGVKRLGNLKFATSLLYADPEIVTSLHVDIGSRPHWLAACTHAGEEEIILKTHITLKKKYPGLLTLIAPRHPERGAEIARLTSQLGLKTARRSMVEPLTADTDVYIADTLGELGLFYRVAPIAFIGGSLVPEGGHNPLEAAHLNCAILSGPHYRNFMEPVSELQTAGAIKIVKDAETLGLALHRLFDDPSVAKQHAAAARQVAADSQAVLARILQELSPLLPVSCVNPKAAAFHAPETVDPAVP